MTAALEVFDWDAFAFEKLAKVLGEPKARATMDQALAQIRRTGLHSADDLYLFAQELTSMPGFARAVGGMLSLQAVMRGARPAS